MSRDSDGVSRVGAKTSTQVLAALAEATVGRIFDLSFDLSSHAPRLDDQSPYSQSLWSNPIMSVRYYAEEYGAKNDIGFADERISLDLHTGTHIDALGHVSISGRMFGGMSVIDNVGSWGLKRLGVESVPPIIARGVLIDIAKYLGRYPEGGEVIGVKDLRQCLEKSKVQLEVGDVVFVRTGWSRFYEVDNERYTDSAPGLNLESAMWLADRGPVAIGADTMSLEVEPGEDPEELYPVHGELLVKRGIYLIEQANLEPLSDAGVVTFLCLALPVRFRGATASPIRLTAIS